MPSSPAPAYEQRITLFIDFLGFKELVDETESDAQRLTHLIRAMDALGEIADETVESEQISQFSDSIVVSYALTEISGVFWLLNSMALAIVDLASRGYLVRGGVTVGHLYHTPQHVVGPALIRAHYLESKVADVPRVVIDPKLIEVARRYRGPHHSADEEEEYARAFVQPDSDGQFYFDYVSWETVVAHVGAPDEEYGDYVARLSQLIERGLSHKDRRVARKYLWLHRHYLSALDEMANSSNQYKAQSARNVEIVAALPRFEELSARVRADVDTTN